MKKIALIALLLSSLLYADKYKVNNFESDIFSKDGNNLKKVKMSLIFEGRDLKENDYKILDTLNIIVSSFYVEDLFTSQGKERFKTLLTQYISKKYMIDIDFIYIIKFETKQDVDVDRLIQKLKKQSIVKPNKEVKIPLKEYAETMMLE